MKQFLRQLNAMSDKDKALILWMIPMSIAVCTLLVLHLRDELRFSAIETQIVHDANCIATLEVLQQAREQAEAGR